MAGFISLKKNFDISMPSSNATGGVLCWYGPLASLSLQIASVASERHDKITILTLIILWLGPPLLSTEVIRSHYP